MNFFSYRNRQWCYTLGSVILAEFVVIIYLLWNSEGNQNLKNSARLVNKAITTMDSPMQTVEARIKNMYDRLMLVEPAWNVAISVSEEFPNVSFVCGGILIHPRIVLSSASCFQDVSVLRIGISDENNVFRKVQSIFPHPDFTKGSYYNDLALLMLENMSKGKAKKSRLKSHPRSKADANLSDSSRRKYMTDTISKTVFKSGKHNNGALSKPWPFWVTDWYIPEQSAEKFGIKILPAIEPFTLVPKTECEELYDFYFRWNSMNFYDIFPEGIGSSFCISSIRTDKDPQQSFSGYQLLVTTTSTSSSSDSSLTFVVMGTRAQAKENRIFESMMKGVKDPYKYNEQIRLPLIFTNIVYYQDWVASTVEMITSLHED